MTHITRRRLLLTTVAGAATAALGGMGITPARATITGSSWMSAMPDSTRLNLLSIPGTHQSGATKPIVFVQCQTTTIRQQLDMGVRFLDVRVKVSNDDGTLQIHHDRFYQNLSMDAVLRQCSEFLTAHPSESIIMSVMQESWEERPEAQLAAAWKPLEEAYRSRLMLGSSIPTLAAARGKIVVVTRSSGIPGYPWAQCDVADDYLITSRAKWDSVKWPGVVANLEQARAASDSTLYVTFGSCTSYPKGVLVTPQTGASWMESKLREYLASKPVSKGEHWGIIPLDFIKPEQARQIAARNFGSTTWP